MKTILGGGSNFLFSGIMLTLFLIASGSEGPEIGFQIGCYAATGSGLAITFILSRLIMSREDRWNAATGGREFWDVGLTGAVLNFLVLTASISIHVAAIQYAFATDPMSQPVDPESLNRSIMTTAGALVLIILIPAAVAIGWWQRISVRSHAALSIVTASVLFPVFLLIYGIFRNRGMFGDLAERPLYFAAYCAPFAAIIFVSGMAGNLLAAWLIPKAQRAVIRMSRLVDDKKRLHQMIDELARLETLLPDDRDMRSRTE